MLRITQCSGHGSNRPITLRVEGRLTDRWLGEFQRTCEPFLHQPHRLRLDLAGVAFIDDAGIEALRRLMSLDIPVDGCSPFISELLKEKDRES